MKNELYNSSNYIHTTIHSGKLEGITSINTSVALNARCAKNATIPCSICEKCYARPLLKMRKGLNDWLEINTERLTKEIIAFDLLPYVNTVYGRFESFGDLNNEVQFINYLNICEKNSNATFAIWTKNPDIMHNVFNMGYKKPANLSIGISSLFMNKVVNVEKYKYFADFVFTVYTADFAIENNITINCGGLHCLSCLKCYKAHQVDGIIYINEMLKSQLKRYNKLLAEKEV